MASNDDLQPAPVSIEARVNRAEMSLRDHIDAKIGPVADKATQAETTANGIRKELKHYVSYKSLWQDSIKILAVIAAAVAAGAAIGKFL